jgi:hypothetical protein
MKKKKKKVRQCYLTKAPIMVKNNIMTKKVSVM